MIYALKTKANQVVLFMDILGFSNIMYRNDKCDTKNDEKDNIILDFEFIYNTINDLCKNRYNEVKFTWGSDSLIISSDINHINCILEEFFIVQQYLLCSGMLLRGSIYIGRLYHKDNVWGEALVHAVELEKYKAIYPRILISKSDFAQLNIDNQYLGYFFEDCNESEYMYIDTFSYGLATAIQNINEGLNCLIHPILNIYIEEIEKNCIDNMEDNDIIKKYQHLACTMVKSLNTRKIDISRILEKESKVTYRAQSFEKYIARLEKIIKVREVYDE